MQGQLNTTGGRDSHKIFKHAVQFFLFRYLSNDEL